MTDTHIMIIGIYTLAYVAVFIIQFTQIRKYKTMTDSMEKFMNIFDPDKLVKYNKIVEELKDLQLEKRKKELDKTDENIKERAEMLKKLINEVDFMHMNLTVATNAKKRIEIVDDHKENKDA